jgi:alpha,alpha-trehalase
MPVETFEELYAAGRIEVPELDIYHTHDRAMRESGHDTSYRWFVDCGEPAGPARRDRCADFVTVDLNCLLHKYEIDIARVIEEEFDGLLYMERGEPERSTSWRALAERRRTLIREYLWDEILQLFLDYDFVNEESRRYVTAAVFYPLWSCHPDDPTTRIIPAGACSSLVKSAMSRLEERGGLAASAEESLESIRWRGEERQWDHPYGWAPHQMIAWRGLLNYGFEAEANRLIYRWLYMIAGNAADYNGTIPEKYDVVGRTHEVFAEYGNVGTEFDYITMEGFGWMNASYQVGLSLLSREYMTELEALVPPENLFTPLSDENRAVGR